ncbi:MAG TPA: hypothetical protein VFH03_20450 [Actinoplanes sp.]|nr:hypothetical protein [Actinoplanes sp.]
MTTVHPPQTPASSATGRTPRAGATRSGIGWIVTGSVVLLTAIMLLITGVVVRVIDDSWRRDGYLTSSPIPLNTDSHAIATQRLDMADIAPLWPDVNRLLGDVRLRATGTAGSAVFIGVAPADRVAAYLDGVGHATLTELADPATTYATHPGGPPATKPADQDFWVAQASGTGAQAVEWPLDDGAWTVVVMNADGSPGIGADIDVGITAPVQDWAAQTLLVGSSVIGLIGITLILIGGYRRRHAH